MSDVIGWQEPPVFSLPEIQVGTLGQECIDLAQTCGLYLDPWQQWLVYHTLSYRPETIRVRDGSIQHKWAAVEVGLMVSRQNGKGSYLEAIELAWLFLLGDEQIIHSAHDFKTSMKHMKRMEDLISNNTEFSKKMRAIRRSNGSEGFTLKSGQELAFITRTKGGSRGWSAEKIVLDEAMYATPQQMGAIMFTQSAMPNPQRILTGSAGDKESISFGSMRRRALDTESPDPKLFWAEWSIEPHNDDCTGECTEHDETNSVESYAKSNPAYNIRVTHETIEDERRTLIDSPEIFLQERLGVGDWPTEFSQWTIVPKKSWFDLKEPASFLDDGSPFAIGVHTSQDLKWSCITVCGKGPQGKTHIEITGRGTQYDYRAGTSWVTAQIIDLTNKWGPAVVVIDKRGQAGMFIDELELFKVPVISPNATEYAQACGDLFLDVVPPKGGTPNLVHLGQPALTTAVAAADKRDLGNTWVWTARLPSADITPLQSATLARWGYLKVRNDKSKRSKPWVARR